MTVERIRDGLLQRLAHDRCPRQALQQDLALIEEARGAIAALKGEMRDERLLQGRELAVPRVPLDGADRFAVEIHGGGGAGGGGGGGAGGGGGGGRGAPGFGGAPAR